MSWISFLDAALLAGKARVLADGKGLVTGYGYHVATPDAIAHKAELLRDFDERVARAYRWANIHEREYGEALAKATGLPSAVAPGFLRRNNPHSVPLSDRLADDARQVVGTIAKEEGVRTASRDVRGAFAREFLVR